MFELMPLEKQVLVGILLLSAVNSVLAHVQLVRSDLKLRHLIVAFTSLQVCLAAVLLVLRALQLKTFAIMGIFESMLILMMFIGIAFLFLSAFMQQVWFLSVIVWVLFVITLLTAVVAGPAAVLQQAAQTPWVVFHALSMSLAGATIVLAAAMSVLFLWSRRRLKSKQFISLLGRMPTIEKLEALILLGLRLSFAAMTLGLVSGIGLVAITSAGLGMTPGEWLTDSKVMLIAAAWILLLTLLVLRRLLALTSKTVAIGTICTCVLILFAFVGSKVFYKSGHDFGRKPTGQNIKMNNSCRYY